jgi:hypothetical protein
MQDVLKRLADDIKNCGNVCDKYMKKSTIGTESFPPCLWASPQ